MGAGGLQAMVKSGLPIQGKRIVIAGTGPLLLAVAVYLRKHGAIVLIVCEQASRRSLARFALSLASFPGKIRQAWGLKKDLGGIRFAANSWPIAARGNGALESVTISLGGKLETIACDYLACGFHLVPNVELAALLGCKISVGNVEVNELQETSVAKVFCAGEPTGIGGLESALVEGQIAGLAAAGKTQKARDLFGERQRTKRFTRLLDQTFRLRPELKSLAKPDTHRLPLRRRSVRAAGTEAFVAIGETADALRNGPLPGTDMRSGNRVSFRLDAGFSSPAHFSGQSR